MGFISKTWERVIALTAIGALAVVAGCTSTSPTDTGSGSGGEIDTSAVLKFASAGPLRDLDPALQTSYGAWGYLFLVWDRLTMLDKDDKIVPGLAKEWNFVDNGSVLELKLRDDVKFHDGTPFDAEAVKANIERGKTLQGSTLKSDLADIESVEVVDAKTVRLKLVKGKGVQLPASFTGTAGMMVSPKAIKDGVDIKNNPGTAGSGPYIATQLVPQEKLVLKRADSYWDPSVGRLGGIELQRVPDAAARLNGLQSGQVDLAPLSSASEIAQAGQIVGKGSGLQKHDVKFKNLVGVYMRATKGDVAKLPIRQAIAQAIDPAAIGALFSGYCTPTRQLVPETDPSRVPGYTYPYEFSVDKAKALVQQAGGAKVTVTFAAGTNAEQPANVVQASLRAVGIDATLNPVPNTENEPRFIAGDFELMVATSWSPKADPAATVNTYLLNTYKLAADPSLIAAKAAEAANPMLSMDKRAPLYQDIWKTTLEQAWFVPLCNQTVANVAKTNVVGIDNIPMSNIGIWDLRYIAVKK
ncbi:ABC transporter substrate-binding protein [Dactylosporangium sp. CA-052675]|uniref:ABC transporter substrate-binding protein n=1 Tax=Dactylosporangium sp. CA-052675 TaxID=3239927 RepID=UPI003D91BFA7